MLSLILIQLSADGWGSAPSLLVVWPGQLPVLESTGFMVWLMAPCLFNLYAEYIMRNSGLNEAQAGIKIAGRNINNLRYADDTTLTAESEEELKKPLDESERGF